MRFDDIFPYLGDFGPYQRRQYFMLGMVIFSCGVQVMMTVFTLAVPPHRCSLPDVPNDTYITRDLTHARLVQEVIPIDSAHSNQKSTPDYSKCYIFSDSVDGGNYSSAATETNAWPSPDVINMTDIVGVSSNASQHSRGTRACSRWVFDTTDYTSTIVTQMEFVCDRDIERSHATMTIMVGQVIGCLILGPVADFVGRKKALMNSLTIHLLASVLISWSVNIYMLGTLYLLNGLAMAAAYCAAFTLGMELIGPKWRHVTGVSATMFWSVGMLWLCLLAFFLRDWQQLQLAASCPIILFAAFFCVVPESARWLIHKGRMTEAKTIIKNAANMNGRCIPDFMLSRDTDEDPAVRSESILSLFKHPALLLRALIIFFNWGVCSLTYYGLGLNVGQLSGNIYLNFCLSAVFEIAATLVIVLAMGKFGRKSLYCSLLLLGSVSCILTLFPVLYGDKSVQWTVSMLAMIGKFGVSGAFAIVWMFTSELFPTSFRASVTGVSSASARVGAVIASYIANLTTAGDIGIILPQLVFGSCGLVASALALLLPETQTQQLPDSIQDAVKFSTDKRIEKSSQENDGADIKMVTSFEFKTPKSHGTTSA
ncbi:hypothetical protein Btru_056021 [Bulinus truncatus]|nr:hypothetical protein Btru_056021 [Bulinus truncatus]